MTHKCNGCGGEMDVDTFDTDELGGTFSYGNTQPPREPDYAQHFPDGEIPEMVQAENHKTLCPKCTRVMKDILLNSDLSEHWSEDDG
jgi:hypothetical protein